VKVSRLHGTSNMQASLGCCLREKERKKEVKKIRRGGRRKKGGVIRRERPRDIGFINDIAGL